MFCKKLTLSFVVSLIGVASSAWAASPEFTVLENIVALQGQNLPSAQKEIEFNQAVNTYFATATQEGQQARLSQALSDLQILSPAQAASFMTNAEAAAARVSSSTTTVNVRSQVISSEITTLARNSFMGAQFSARDCALEVVGGLGVGALSGYLGYLDGKWNNSAEYPVRGGVAVGIAIGAFAELIVFAAGDC